MADAKLEDLTEKTTLADDDLVYVVDPGGSPEDRYITGANLKAQAVAYDADISSIAGLSPSNDDVLQRKAGAWANRTIAQLLADLAAAGTTFQPLDSDLTAIAALTTTSFGRSLLTSADAAALRVTLGMTVSSGPFWCGNPDLRDPASFGSATAPGSNIAQFEGFIVTTPVVINRMVVVIGTASGNADFGIYASDGTSAAPGTKLVSTGSISCPAATYNTVTLTDTLLLPGFYYKSFAFDNGTATLWKNGANTMNQWKQLVTNPHYTKTSSFPLPSSVTSPTADTATTQWNLIPGRI